LYVPRKKITENVLKTVFYQYKTKTFKAEKEYPKICATSVFFKKLPKSYNWQKIAQSGYPAFEFFKNCYFCFKIKIPVLGMEFIHNEKQLFSLRDTAMQMRSQRPLHVQGDAGHPG
jgi:hypothetical protein